MRVKGDTKQSDSPYFLGESRFFVEERIFATFPKTICMRKC